MSTKKRCQLLKTWSQGGDIPAAVIVCVVIDEQNIIEFCGCFVDDAGFRQLPFCYSMHQQSKPKRTGRAVLTTQVLERRIAVVFERHLLEAFVKRFASYVATYTQHHEINTIHVN